MARAEGHTVAAEVVEIRDKHGNWIAYHPSANWAQGGPIVERLGIDILANGKLWRAGFNTRIEASGEGYDFIEWIELDHEQDGPTPLVAAMRARVQAKFGDEVPDDADVAEIRVMSVLSEESREPLLQGILRALRRPAKAGTESMAPRTI